MKLDWVEVKAEGRSDTKDAAANIMIEAGSGGVIEGGIDDKLVAPDERVKSPLKALASSRKQELLTAFFDAGSLGKASVDGLLKEVARGLKGLGWRIKVRPYVDTDWQEEWKKGIKTTRSGRFLVHPPWKKVKAKKGELRIVIEPGMAFGTGTHPTTRLCLKLLSGLYTDKKIQGKSVIDVGTGSGILGIAARKLGAGPVTCTDNDPVALKVARANAKVNKVNIRTTAKEVLKVAGVYDVVVANIISSILISLNPGLTKKTRPGGVLLLSGILKSEVKEVGDIFKTTGFKILKTATEGEWSALLLMRDAKKVELKHA